jgi:hypothetical protein
MVAGEIVAQDPMKKPLGPTESLGLSGSKEEMLVVVVPSSKSAS